MGHDFASHGSHLKNIFNMHKIAVEAISLFHCQRRFCGLPLKSSIVTR